MLVLTHRPGDKISLNADGVEITLQVIEVKGKQIKLGYKAPAFVKIVRENAILKEPKETVTE